VFTLGNGVEHSASCAVDGVYEGADSDIFSMAHSQQELRPWWRVDLAGTHCVWAVNILNRYDGNFYITKLYYLLPLFSTSI